MKMKPLIEKIADNLPAKIICLVIAVIIYLIYQFSTLSKKNFAVPLTVEATGDFLPASAAPKMVRLTVRGSNDELIQLQESDFSAYLDLSYFSRDGTYSVPVQIRLSSHAASFNPLEVDCEPSSVSLKVEQRLISHVPVKPVFVGEPVNGFELSSFSLSSDVAQISGPRSLVEIKTEIATEAVFLSNRFADFSLSAPLVNRSSLIQIDQPRAVTVNGVIKQKEITKFFENQPVVVFMLTPKLRADFTARASVRLSGYQNLLSTFTFDEGTLAADCSNLTAAGTYEVPLLVRVPEGLTVIQAPETVTVTVSAVK